ncbi:unnamed protein product, partial [Rotaria sp. Silwood1]
PTSSSSLLVAVPSSTAPPPPSTTTGEYNPFASNILTTSIVDEDDIARLDRLELTHVVVVVPIDVIGLGVLIGADEDVERVV